uniref:CUB and zona pellucida-like domains 1, tandem duplicate 1 n=1 Tax=Haplochromis burtoni TaxID=8153 RepID=A0A3Q2VSL9_HAPBU
DYVYVYDGSSTGSRLLGKTCNNTKNNTFYSTGYYLTVRFRSDGLYSCLYNCGAHLGSCSCTSSCEYYGNCCHDYYQPSCRYNCGMHLGSCSCRSSCQYNGDCCYDYYPSCRYNCGSYMGSCSCSSSCEYYGNCCYDYYCGGNLFGSGTFSSPNYPSYYHDNAYCMWQLRAAYDQRIFLQFTFLLENCCSCDYIEIYDGPYVYSPFLGKVCNNSLSTFFSTSNYMTVVFRTDGSMVGRGFNAEFTSSLTPSSRVDCSSDNMNIVIEKSYLNSLGYDGHSLYLNDPHCRPQISYYNVVFSFPLNTCGNTRENGKIVYTNSLRAYNSNYGEITRQSNFKLNVNCRMEEDSVSQILYEVRELENTTITGTGRYNTSMVFYQSSSFYYCPIDNTYYAYTTGTSPFARFTFKAFQFLRATEDVYLQCKVLICPASDYNSRCR